MSGMHGDDSIALERYKERVRIARNPLSKTLIFAGYDKTGFVVSTNAAAVRVNTWEANSAEHVWLSTQILDITMCPEFELHKAGLQESFENCAERLEWQTCPYHYLLIIICRRLVQITIPSDC